MVFKRLQMGVGQLSIANFRAQVVFFFF